MELTPGGVTLPQDPRDAGNNQTPAGDPQPKPAPAPAPAPAPTPAPAPQNDHDDDEGDDDDDPVVVGGKVSAEELARILNSLKNARREKRDAKRDARQARTALDAANQTIAQLQSTQGQLAIVTQERDALRSQVQRLEQAVGSDLDTEIGAWPEEVKATLPDNADVATKLTWATKMRPVVKKLTGATVTGGNPLGPPPAGNGARTPGQEAEAQQRLRRQYKNIW